VDGAERSAEQERAAQAGPGRRQRVHSSVEASVMDVERRERREADHGMNRDPEEQTPAPVSRQGETKQVGSSPKPKGQPPRPEAEPEIWTERMLRTLEHGVKGGKWYSLMHKVYATRGRGRDHQRWPNAFFANHGLFSLVTAHAEASQSCHRQTTNWRAVCGRTACTVRREEERSRALPTPIQRNSREDPSMRDHSTTPPGTCPWRCSTDPKIEAHHRAHRGPGGRARGSLRFLVIGLGLAEPPRDARARLRVVRGEPAGL
jgi:hypothetical protein